MSKRRPDIVYVVEFEKKGPMVEESGDLRSYLIQYLKEPWNYVPVLAGIVFSLVFLYSAFTTGQLRSEETRLMRSEYASVIIPAGCTEPTIVDDPYYNKTGVFAEVVLSLKSDGISVNHQQRRGGANIGYSTHCETISDAHLVSAQLLLR